MSTSPQSTSKQVDNEEDEPSRLMRKPSASKSRLSKQAEVRVVFYIPPFGAPQAPISILLIFFAYVFESVHLKYLSFQPVHYISFSIINLQSVLHSGGKRGTAKARQ